MRKIYEIPKNGEVFDYWTVIDNNVKNIYVKMQIKKIKKINKKNMKEEKEKSEVDSKEKLEEGQPIKVDWEPTEIDRFVYLYRVIFSQWYSVAEIFTKFFANHMNIRSSEMTEEDKSVVDKTKKEIEKVYKGIMDLFD